jgi:hypothetical protein
MIVGIFRPRFRVSNPKNAGVRGAWSRIIEGNRDAFELVQRIRVANGLQPLQPSPEIEAGSISERAEAEETAT